MIPCRAAVKLQFWLYFWRIPENLRSSSVPSLVMLVTTCSIVNDFFSILEQKAIKDQPICCRTMTLYD